MKILMRPNPTQLTNRIRLVSGNANPFNRDKYLMFGYRSLTGVIIAGGGKGGNGGSGVVATYKPDRPVAGMTYYSRGGGGAGGSSGGKVTIAKTSLQVLSPAALPVVVGSAATASSWNGTTSPAGISGGNGGVATATAGGAAGVKGTAPTGGVAGTNGEIGGSYNSAGFYVGLTGTGGSGGAGYTDPSTSLINGVGGTGGTGGVPTASAGSAGTSGVVIFQFSTVQ